MHFEGAPLLLPDYYLFSYQQLLRLYIDNLPHDAKADPILLGIPVA